MRLPLYAESPGRRTTQVLGDVLLVVWVYAWVKVGMAVQAATLRLADPGRRLEAGAGDVATSLRDAGRGADRIPVVGDRVRDALDSAAGAGDAIAEAGHRQVEVVQNLATLLAVVIAAVPILLVLVLWVPGRVRFVRRAVAARRFLDSDADLTLFALRAMAHQPLPRLARITHDPVGAWRAGDRDVVLALADLELRDAGLRAPTSRPDRAGWA
ncbi:MAG: hypothetical protein ACLGIA_01715 [Actinomycetes bacterium]